jgi:cyclin B
LFAAAAPGVVVRGSDLVICAEMGNRRALTDIKNLVGAAPYPCAVAKKPMLQ